MPQAVPLALLMASAALALATDVPALPALRCPLNATRSQCQHSYNDDTFEVGGNDLRFEYDENSLRLECSNDLQLDWMRAYLPQFTSALRVMYVTVTHCQPAHYAAVFAALNVTPTSPFSLELHAVLLLTTAHFANLPPLRHLMLHSGWYAGELHDLPATLKGLTTLSLKNMIVPDGILEALPRTLTELRLEDVDIRHVPAALLDLTKLRSLHMEARFPVTVERSNTSRLLQLYVQRADAALMSDWAPPALEEVTLEYWRAESPNQLPACDKLVKLTLVYPHASELPAGWVARCPLLKELLLMYTLNLSEVPANLLENATQVTSLGIIYAIMSSLPSQLFANTPHLTHLDLSYNQLIELPPQLLANTLHLTYLNLNHNKLTYLPPQLISNTSHLIHLYLSYNQLIELPPQLLANTLHLTYLNLNHNKLTHLPPQLITNTTHLSYLDLSYNQLIELPPQLFANTPHLTHLVLSYNRLIQLPSALLTLPLLSLDLGYNGLNASVVAELATFTELRNLSLAGNRELGDLCAVNDSDVIGISSLASLLKLERLILQGTNISVICSDWREDMVNLTYLDLSYTKLGNLTYEEIQYNRNVPAVVVHPGTIYFTADDYDRAAAAAAFAAPDHNVAVMLITEIIDGCSLYWITKAINDDLLPLYDVKFIHNWSMNRPTSLRLVRPEDLLCPSRETCAAVPYGCDCGMAGDGLLRIVCVGVELDRVPQLPSLNNDTNLHAVDLVLVNNTITELVVDDLPPHLRVLDLRNNSISYMTETTARALTCGTKRRVLLAGTQLECSCQTNPALRVLCAHVGYDSQDTIKDGCSKFSASLATIIAVLMLALWLARDKQ